MNYFYNVLSMIGKNKLKNTRSIISFICLLFFMSTSFAQTQQNNDLKVVADTSKGTIDTKKGVTPANKDARQVNGDTLTAYEKKIFGYNIFRKPGINFTPNLNMATPKSYVVGPSDILSVQVYGIAQNKYTLEVSPEGTVTIPEIGMAKVGGFSIEAVKAILQQKLSIRYIGMKASPANTFIEVTLDNIRTIKVNMVGEIAKPGTFLLPSYITVFDALFAAGGPNAKGSFRHIQVIRAGKKVAEIDVYDFLLNGKTTNNIRLEDGDVILINPAAKRIELEGEVKTPGIFEILNNESLTDLIKFSGGFTEIAYREILNITRVGITEKQVLTVTKSQYNNVNLTDGDLVTVAKIQDRFTNRVQITGPVDRPGAYELSKGMTVQDLIQKAGGLKGDAFLPRALLYRTKPDLTQDIVRIDLSNTNKTGGIATILLEKEDVLSISRITDLQEQYYVQVSGEVNNPGVFAFADSMTASDLIFLAGGYKYAASANYIEIARRILATSPDQNGKDNNIAEILKISTNRNLDLQDSARRLYLKPFDHLFIRNTPGYVGAKTVTVQGEVNYPGKYIIDRKEMRISDLLLRAGGLTKYAYTRGATLVRRTKNYKGNTQAEEENLNLNSLKENLTKDPFLAIAEANKDKVTKVDARIRANDKSIATEKELKEAEQKKQLLLKDNSSLTGKNTVQQDEKQQELVALNFEEILKNPGSVADLLLKEGDILDIPELLETVSMKGGVLYPVSVRYEQGLHFREYINRSGGYSIQAVRNRAYVLQANGKVERVKHFLFFKSYPKILPGAEVFVPINTVEKPPFTYDKALGLITSTLTLIFIIRAL
jgi:protein involved in polysaccharide export with SLBB domain